MQSVLAYFLIGILTLEIVYFLLCIVTQFKHINVTVVVSALIHLGLLFLVNRLFISPIGAGEAERSVMGFIIFSLLGLSIIGSDERDLLVKKKVALKLPFMGLFLGYFIIAGDVKINFLLLFLVLLTNLYFLYRTRERFRLYFRSYIFFMLSLVGLLIGLLAFEKQIMGLVLGAIFAFFGIMYLQQFLNLILVKTYIRETL